MFEEEQILNEMQIISLPLNSEKIDSNTNKNEAWYKNLEQYQKSIQVKPNQLLGMNLCENNFKDGKYQMSANARKEKNESQHRKTFMSSNHQNEKGSNIIFNTNVNKIKQNNNNKNKNFILSNNPKNNNPKNNNLKRIQRLYTQTATNFPFCTLNNNISSFNKLSMKSIDGQNNTKYNTHNYAPNRTNISKEELYEQNIQLKNTINELKVQLKEQKVQTQLQMKKNRKYTRKFSREFKKDFYYSYINQSNKNIEAMESDGLQQSKNNIQNIQQQQQNESLNNYNNIKINFTRRNNGNINFSNTAYGKLQKQQQRCMTQHKKYNLNKGHDIINYQLATSKKYSLKSHSFVHSNDNNNQVVGSSKKKIVNTNYDFYSNNKQGILNHTISNHGNEYLIAGIKEKYEELKDQNNLLKEELQKIKQIDSFQQLQQINIYCSVLETSNQQLAHALEVTKIKVQSYENGQLHRERDQTMYNQAMVLQFKRNLQKLREKNNALKIENKRIKQQSEENEKTIIYLEKLLIINQNTQMNAVHTCKKLNFQVEALSKQLEEQRESNKVMKNSYMRKLQELSSKYQKQMESDRTLFEEALVERNVMVKKLQKQVNYLTTIIEYWKSTNQQNSMIEQPQQAQKDEQKQKYSMINCSASIKNIQLIVQRKQQQKQYNLKVHQIAQVVPLAKQISLDKEYKEQKLQKSNTIGGAEVLGKKMSSIKQRKRKSAGQKNTDNGKKMRKVSIQQISELAEYIRYRLIGRQTTIERAIKLFDYNPPNFQLSQNCSQGKIINFSEAKNTNVQQPSKLTQLQVWKNRYINLSEIKTILISEPFNLKPSDALLLSRYIVEDECVYEKGDTHNGFVYFDEQNEIERVITQSIMKAFLRNQQSNLLEETANQQFKFDACKNDWARIMQKNGNKLNTALISMAPNGIIAKDKWNDILESFCQEMSQNTIDWTVGKMLMQSEGMDKLQYQLVMPNVKE